MKLNPVKKEVFHMKNREFISMAFRYVRTNLDSWTLCSSTAKQAKNLQNV